MPSTQTTIPAAAGGFAHIGVPIPAGTCCARVQPVLSDSDWADGQQLTITIQASLQGQVSPDAPGCVLQTGALQSDPTHPIPCYGQLNNPTPWQFDTIVISVWCENRSVEIGALVSFADAPLNMPAPVLPPGFVEGTKL